jgi:hypothetical protein
MFVLFGHQSVGQNLLDGVRDLGSDGLPVPALLSLDDTTPPCAHMAVCAFRVGHNRDPVGKFRHFSEVAAGEAGRRADLAMLKLCYADIEDTTAIAGLFDAYREMLAEIRSHRPALEIAHCTVPLRSVATGAAAGIRRLLARNDREASANGARHAYNELLRERFAEAGTLFDLAGLEAGPERNTRAPALSRALTDDGGHLNAAGRRVVAREFLAFLEGVRRNRRGPRPT